MVRRSLIKKRAASLIKAVEVESAPIPVEECARHLGATIRFQPLEGTVSGLVYRGTDGKTVIGINSLHSENRKRFSIAHEIGHLLLHSKDELHVDEHKPSLLEFRDSKSSMGVEEKEIEANQFAAELLMPEEMLVRDFHQANKKESDPEDIIEELAELYEASVQSMTIRLTRLGLIR